MRIKLVTAAGVSRLVWHAVPGADWPEFVGGGTPIVRCGEEMVAEDMRPEPRDAGY